MPIKPENKGRYPANWPEIRQRVLKRAKGKCEGCGVKNHALGFRRETGEFLEMGQAPREGKPIRIILTIAHLNHIPEDCRMENLRAWCQRCHNRYDIEHRKQTRRAEK